MNPMVSNCRKEKSPQILSGRTAAMSTSSVNPMRSTNRHIAACPHSTRHPFSLLRFGQPPFWMRSWQNEKRLEKDLASPTLGSPAWHYLERIKLQGCELAQTVPPEKQVAVLIFTFRPEEGAGSVIRKIRLRMAFCRWSRARKSTFGL